MTNIARRQPCPRIVSLVGAASVAAGVSLAAPATPAWAHARLLSSTPGDHTTVAEAITEVSLTFSDAPKEQFTTIVVTGPDGSALVDGRAKVRDRTIVQPVRTPPTGTVRVAWRTVSADGHPVEGVFSFTVASGAGASQAGGADPAETSRLSPTAPAIGNNARNAENAGNGGNGKGTDVENNAAVRSPLSDPGGMRAWMWLLGGGVLLLSAAAVTVFWRERKPTKAPVDAM